MNRIYTLAESTEERLPPHVEHLLSLLNKNVDLQSEVESDRFVQRSIMLLCVMIVLESGFSLSEDEGGRNGQKNEGTTPFVEEKDENQTKIDEDQVSSSPRKKTPYRLSASTFDLHSIFRTCMDRSDTILNIVRSCAPGFRLDLKPSDLKFHLLLVPMANVIIVNLVVDVTAAGAAAADPIDLQFPSISRTLTFSTTIQPKRFVNTVFGSVHAENFIHLDQLSLDLKDKIVAKAINCSLYMTDLINTRSIAGLPEEVLMEIMFNLKIDSVLSFISSSKCFYTFGQSTALWRALLKRDFGIDMKSNVTLEGLVQEYKLQYLRPSTSGGFANSTSFFRSVENMEPRRFYTSRSNESDSFNSIAPYIIALRQNYSM